MSFDIKKEIKVTITASGVEADMLRLIFEATLEDLVNHKFKTAQFSSEQMKQFIKELLKKL